MPLSIDILENKILEISPILLDTLLKDHTTSTPECQHNIIWATTDYESLGSEYQYNSQILPHLITGENGDVIKPRVLKSMQNQKERSRDKAEVFTPSWICNAQNNLIDSAWFGRDDVFNHENGDNSWSVNLDKIEFPQGKTWKDYVRDTRLEITCGEAPYLVSRYDSVTGEEIPIENRIGLLDRKLRVVSENTNSTGEWLTWAQTAFKNTYGYEWQGDSLLIARENLIATFLDYYQWKFQDTPLLKSLLYIAYITSWNLWQMDGLKGVIPDSCGFEDTLFGRIEKECRGCNGGSIREHNGTYAIIKDWGAKKGKQKIRYIDLIK